MHVNVFIVSGVYMHVHMHVHVYMCECVCMCINVCTCVSFGPHVYVCACICMCICVNVCVGLELETGLIWMVMMGENRDCGLICLTKCWGFKQTELRQ